MKFHWKAKKEGQSIPIIALMIVVLFAMVGLSVDVGNTYAEQRNAVRGADAASLAGMQQMLRSNDDSAVAKIIQGSLKSNGLRIAGADGVPPDARDARQLTTAYLDASGQSIGSCEVGSCGEVPASAKYIKVSVSGTVDTYFARVVGRQTLPVAAQSYAAYCAPKDNVFPLAVNQGTIAINSTPNSVKFSDPGTNPDKLSTLRPSAYNGVISGKYGEDSQYPFPRDHLYWRRLFLTAQQPGDIQPYQLRLLSWRSGEKSDPDALTAAFTGVGTMDKGITEARWPQDFNKVDVPGKPDGYPVHPGTLDKDEWLYGFGESAGSVSPSNWANVAQALSVHAQNRDTLILPIVESSAVADQDANGYLRYKVSKLGLFRIANGNNGIFNNSNYMYVDLAYLGDIKGVACLQVPPTNPPNSPPCQPDNPACTPPVKTNVLGLVNVKPVWKDQSGGRQPISYQIILDTSGSMVMDMYGDANMPDGTPVLCADESTFGKASNYAYNKNCNPSGDQQVWNKVEERRIYIAKQAVIRLINGMEPDKGDMMRVIAFSKGDKSSVGSDSVQVLPADGWSSDQSALKTAVLNAGTYNSNPYLSQGTTPTPQALNQTLKLLQSSSAPKEYNNQKYKKIVILITDGMANVFLNGTVNEAGDIPACAALYPTNRVYNTIDCQKGYSNSYKQYRPLDQMIDQANAIKASDPDLNLYVVGMSQVSAYGLEDQVPSNAAMFFRANDPAAVDSALQQIQSSSETSTCIPRTEENFLDVIPDANKPKMLDGNYGYVTIKDANGTLMPNGDRVPLVQNDDTNGKLGWFVPDGGLPPGQYTIQVQVGYIGKDGIERAAYTKIATNNNAYADEYSFTVPASNFGGTYTVQPVLSVNFDKDKEICPPIKK